MSQNDFYKNLEDRFRGASDTIKQRLDVYIPFLREMSTYTRAARAIDLGCGRGEWLDVARQENIRATGIDLDETMLEEASSRGLEVEHGDAIAYLKRLDAESVGLITAFHLVEHLPFTQLQELLAEIYRCLAPGGIVILETPNPENLSVATLGFNMDPTHNKPLPPALLSFVVEQCGYERTKILRLNENPKLHAKTSLAFSDVITGASPDYSVIAQKHGGVAAAEVDRLFKEERGLTLEGLAHDYDGNLRELRAGLEEQARLLQVLDEEIKSKISELAAGVKEQGEWVQDFSGRHAVFLDFLDKKISRIEAFSLVGIVSFLGAKFQELYWTVTRAAGLAHLHDGTGPRHDESVLKDAKEAYGRLPLYNEPLAVNLAYVRLCEATKFLARASSGVDKKQDLRRMAFVSPLPPQKTGVADYSHELLQLLGKHYEIVAIVEDRAQVISSIENVSAIEDVAWFEEHAFEFDRILYQFGNSENHAFMLALLRKFPGVVVMHDFYLGHFIGGVDKHQPFTGIWPDELYRSEGYTALVKRFSNGGDARALQECPVNFSIMQEALGVIFHSRYSYDMAQKFYGEEFARHCRIVPHGRTSSLLTTRANARATLGINENDFVVCSFGFLGPNKLSQEIFDAWRKTSLPETKPAKLIFVGEAPSSSYCKKLQKDIEAYGVGDVQITGYVPQQTYRNFLAACDVAIQLRTNSRGETSGATLDCMSAGIPTLVSDHGPFSEIPEHCVIKLPEGSAPEQIAKTLETIASNPQAAKDIAQEAKDFVLHELSFSRIAQKYDEVIEEFYVEGPQIANSNEIIKVAHSLVEHERENDEALKNASVALCSGFNLLSSTRQLFVDVSALVKEDLNSGVQRVVKSQLTRLLENPPQGFRVEPIYLSDQGGEWRFRYANKFTTGFLGLHNVLLDERVITFGRGDIYYMPDLCYWSVGQSDAAGLYRAMQAAGVLFNFVVFDNLPIRLPHCFPEGADQSHKEWLERIVRYADRLICISGAVRDDVVAWMTENAPSRVGAVHCDVLHLGADFRSGNNAARLTDANKNKLLNRLKSKTTFLMVGTIEPRKGYLLALDAFDKLWASNRDVNLVIVGGEGWRGLPDSERRTIPETIRRLKTHPRLDQNLFWINDADDAFLECIYRASTCLIMASEDEGFGLPLIEAANYKIPVIARDIPVFRELLGDGAQFFDGNAGDDLARNISAWIDDVRNETTSSTEDVHWLTWGQNVDKLKEILNI